MGVKSLCLIDIELFDLVSKVKRFNKSMNLNTTFIIT